MKTVRLAATFAMGLSLCLGLLTLLGMMASSAANVSEAACLVPICAPDGELRVCPTGCAYASVQAAVDAARDGDTVKIAAGTYTGTNNYGGLSQLVYISKTLTLQGGFSHDDWTVARPGANHSTLDAQGQGRVVYITGAIQPVIEGLRITGGEAEGLGTVPGEALWDGGGGVFVLTATAVIRNNVVYNNACSSQFCGGGGMLLAYSDSNVSGNIFISNTATWDGGGLQTLYSNAMVTGNEFRSNSVGFGGGAVYLHASTAAFNDNALISNTAEYGGGLVSAIGADRIVNNVLNENRVGAAGGGMWLYGSSAQLMHNTIAANSGGDGSGVYVSRVEYIGPYASSATLTNTLLVSHSVGISITGGNAITVDGILWYGTPFTVSHSTNADVTVLNQHVGNPAFGPDGFHLTADSGAIDHGTNTRLAADIDGEPRPGGSGYDLGADEFWFRISLPTIVRRELTGR